MQDENVLKESFENTLLKLLGQDVNEDIVSFTLDNVFDTVKNYCNISEIPEALNTTILRMSIDLYRNEQLGDSSNPLVVKSISEGDMSTSFDVGGTTEFATSLLKDYKKQLNRFRKVF